MPGICTGLVQCEGGFSAKTFEVVPLGVVLLVFERRFFWSSFPTVAERVILRFEPIARTEPGKGAGATMKSLFLAR